MWKYAKEWSIRLIILTVVLSSCKLGRFVVYNFADIRDHKKFHSRPLEGASEPFQFHRAENGRVPKKVEGLPFDEFLEKNKSVAFLIIRNDTIHYENYKRTIIYILHLSIVFILPERQTVPQF